VGSLADALAACSSIGLDSAPFIYVFERHPEFAMSAVEVFENITQSRLVGFTTVVTFAEIAVIPLRRGRDDIAQQYRDAIANMPNLHVIDIDRALAMGAARLRAAYNLRTPDALQLAACIQAGAEAFITNDRQLQRVREIPVLLLSDFVES
jgi:predicted nucleic acid-binding protein